MPTDVHGVIENIIQTFETVAEEKMVKLVFEPDKTLDVALVLDPTRLSQVLNNLVHNAIKFTEEGSVTIATKVEARTEKAIALTISVKDTGIGIAPEKQKAILKGLRKRTIPPQEALAERGLAYPFVKACSICKAASLS